jgi:hypothetical protein
MIDKIIKKISKIRKERGTQYGGIELSHESIGLIWQGVLQSYYQEPIPPIPPHVVALMMAGLKTSRAATPLGYQEDDYLDFMNYANFGAELDPQRKEGKNADDQKSFL